MIRRIRTLVGYFVRRVLFSLTGLLYALLAGVLWRVFFDPYYLTPNVDYYIALIAVFGALFAFLSTLTIAAYAHQAIHYPVLVRLPRRIEYLAAVLISAFCFGTLLQVCLAILATYNGPHFTVDKILQLPLVWLPVNVLAAVLGLHASNLVTVGWSRAVVYGVLLALALGQSTVVGPVSGLVFWPVRAVFEAIRAGFFDPVQALAPIAILLYAVVLFAVAARLFAGKDLALTE